jgi:CRISPR-associated endonuclease/helicase Cas3
LPSDLQDLLLHLVAAHHGNARPLISTRNAEGGGIPSEARALEVALRFERLQRRWGPWGLAWWESLLRAADQKASRENDEHSEAGSESTRSGEAA